MLPAHSCDSHAHILGPKELYGYSPARIYTPPDCLLPDYLHMLDRLGIERAVLVQPSVYGTDNTVMLEALRTAGDRFRGVAVVEDDISDIELRRLDAAGVRGVRINLVDRKDPSTRTAPFDALRTLATRIEPFGWHMEFLIHVDAFPDLDSRFAGFPVDIVLGHLGYMKPAQGLEHTGFEALLRLAKSGRCWVKLTGPYRISAQPLPYSDVTQFAHALVEAAPDQILWGTDWPHVMLKGTMPNDASLCDLLSDWIPDESLRTRVLVHNPARLYRF
ncbi:MAG: amidohydrolase family protein [Acidimicrobiia bacterium]|nr:amidohydrolase family protein [Acidimicrobiia bacterium]MDH3398026.1 amidohydrolase family protein [Acidimicrobiia bacterium]